MPQPTGVSIAVQIDPKSIKRVTDRLDKWQGKPLEVRTDKAIRAGLSLMIAPIRAGVRNHNVTGKTAASVGVKKLRRKQGEMNSSYKVGIKAKNARSAWYGHFPITGTSRGVGADPYVEAAWDDHREQVSSFIDEQVRRLA